MRRIGLDARRRPCYPPLCPPLSERLQELIHNLYLDRKDYEFVNLAESDYTKGTIVKTSEQDKIDVAKAQGFERAIGILADRYANKILMLYSLVIIASIVIAVVLVLQGSWNELEPWTFILLGPLLVYLIELFAQVVFKREFSIKPSIIHNWLRKHKLRQLNDEFKIEIR